MTSVTTKPELSQPETETAVHLFDNWFDPIEAGLRDRVRELIQAMIEGELDEALSRPALCSPCAAVERRAARGRRRHGSPGNNPLLPPRLSYYEKPSGRASTRQRDRALLVSGKITPVDVARLSQ
jgi:hypothetical protein